MSNRGNAAARAERSAGTSRARGTDQSVQSGRTTNRQSFAPAAALGRLNASHASAMALRNAAPQSAVGRIAAYLDAMSGIAKAQEALQTALAGLASAKADLTSAQKAKDAEAITRAEDALDAATKAVADARQAVTSARQDSLDDAAAALAAAANKEITAGVVQQVNANLGIEMERAEAGRLADRAEALRTGATASVSAATEAVSP